MGEHIIVAGIAAKDQSVLMKCLERNGLRKHNTVTFLTIQANQPIYKKSVIENFIVSFAKTVSRKTPKTVRVVYVPYEGSTILEELFFPFSDIQPLNKSRTYFDYILNHFNDIKEFSHELLQVIRNGLKIKKRPSRRHYLLLPNRNFLIEGRQFFDFLHEFYFGNLDENVFSSIKENKELRCYQDSRNLVFPVTKMNEGNLRYDEAQKHPEHFLKGIYRLGMLWDAGFHFDVKHISKPTLGSYKFICSVNGEVNSSNATHVNIYLNDFVRVPLK